MGRRAKVPLTSILPRGRGGNGSRCAHCLLCQAGISRRPSLCAAPRHGWPCCARSAPGCREQQHRARFPAGDILIRSVCLMVVMVEASTSGNGAPQTVRSRRTTSLLCRKPSRNTAAIRRPGHRRISHARALHYLHVFSLLGPFQAWLHRTRLARPGAECLQGGHVWVGIDST